MTRISERVTHEKLASTNHSQQTATIKKLKVTQFARIIALVHVIHSSVIKNFITSCYCFFEKCNEFTAYFIQHIQLCDKSKNSKNKCQVLSVYLTL